MERSAMEKGGVGERRKNGKECDGEGRGRGRRGGSQGLYNHNYRYLTSANFWGPPLGGSVEMFDEFVRPVASVHCVSAK